MVMAPIDTKRCLPPRPPVFPPVINKPKHDFVKMDGDKNGTISRDEFISNGNPGPVPFLTQRVRSQEFDKLDRNKDGQLSKLEQFVANIAFVKKPKIELPKIEFPKFFG